MAAGDAISKTKPWFYIGDFAPTPAPIPTLSLAPRAPWPNYSRIKGFQNGLTWTINNTKVAISTSDLGNVAWVGNGQHGQTIAAQFRLPTATLIDRLASFFTVTKAAQVGPPAFPAAEIKSSDPNAEFGTNDPGVFRLGIEGELEAGSQYDTKRIVRWVGFKAIQTGAVALKHDHTGNDAGLFPTMAAQLLPHTLAAAELTGSGIVAADIKSDLAVQMVITPAA